MNFKLLHRYWLIMCVIFLTKLLATSARLRHRNYDVPTANRNASSFKMRFYGMCDETGRCLGVRLSASTYRSNDSHSNECIQPGFRNCDYIVAFGCDHGLQEVNFQLYAVRSHDKDSGYVAGALSVDRKMVNGRLVS